MDSMEWGYDMGMDRTSEYRGYELSGRHLHSNGVKERRTNRILHKSAFNANVHSPLTLIFVTTFYS